MTSKGNLWTYPADWRIVTTNGIVKKNGEAVMGAGIAKQAALRFPRLPTMLGDYLKKRGNHVGIFEEFKIITFPTKNHWKDASSLRLIDQSCIEIASTPMGVKFVMPKPGCGLGGLQWEDVRKVCEKRLDDRFIVLV